MKINSERFKNHCIKEVETLERAYKEMAQEGNYADALELKAYRETWEYILLSWEEPEERDFMEPDNGWNDPKVKLPEGDYQVLCLVSGDIEHLHYENAYMTGYYFSEDGGSWGFDSMSYMQAYKLKVKAWRELPGAPEWINNEE